MAAEDIRAQAEAWVQDEIAKTVVFPYQTLIVWIGVYPAPILRRNMLIYGIGGILLPFVGIKLIDMLLVAMRLA